jgi:hypothetical protein
LEVVFAKSNSRCHYYSSYPVKRPESQIEPQSSKYRMYNVIDYNFLIFSTNRTSSNSFNMAPVREYLCNCAEFCMRGGSTEPKSVSKSTYHRHSRYRNPITPMPEFLAQHGIATTSPPSAATVPATCPRDHHHSVTSSQGDPTRRRSHSPIAGPSEQPNKRQRPNEEVIVDSGLLGGENEEDQQEEGSKMNSSIDPGFMQVQLHVPNRMILCGLFSVNNANLIAASWHTLRNS